MNYQELQEAKQTFRIHYLEKEYKTLFKIRDEFVRKYNPKKIAAMTIDEYVQGKQSKTSFCYILERSLKDLGNMTGQYATKFGVWYSKEKGEYSFEPRLGSTYKEVFKKVKKSILDLLKDGKVHDYENIINNPLNALFKGKILAVYYPDDYLNIFSNDHLNYYLKAFDLDTAKMMKQNVLYKRKALIDYKNSDKDMKKWSNDMFSVFLWSHYPKAPLKSDEVAVASNEKEIEFPTFETFSFIDLQLADGKLTSPSKSHSGKPSPDYEKEAKKQGISVEELEKKQESENAESNKAEIEANEAKSDKKKDKDSSASTGFIMVISLIGYYLAMMAGVFKGALFIRILSYVPFISAILAPSLLVLGQIGIIDIVVSIILVMITNYLLIKYGLKIYKVGILNYSSKDLWKKMFKALKD